MNQFLASNSHVFQWHVHFAKKIGQKRSILREIRAQTFYYPLYGVATAYSTNENPSTDKLSRVINYFQTEEGSTGDEDFNRWVEFLRTFSRARLCCFCTLYNDINRDISWYHSVHTNTIKGLLLFWLFDVVMCKSGRWFVVKRTLPRSGAFDLAR